MNCEIISVGTEVVTGDIINTDAPFIAKELKNLGIEVMFHTAVRDDFTSLKDTLNLALSRSDLIITTGGLGPTYDDFTKEVVAKVADLPIIPSKEIENEIRNYFLKSGRTMTENNLKQANIIKDAQVFKNCCGTAPGMAVKINNKIVILLPGPFDEVKPMIRNEVIPYLTANDNKFIYEKIIKLFGIGESLAESQLYDIMTTTKNPILAPYAKIGEVNLKLTSIADTKLQAEELLKPVYDKVYARMEKYIYGEDDDTLVSKAVELLRKKGMKAAFCESCTGGYISKEITSVSGASDVFGFGAVTYANEAKTKLVGVSPITLKNHGAVSEEVAVQMAKGIRSISGADIGIGVTGIAGPDGGTDEKPVGLVYIALNTKNTSVVKKLNFNGDRERIRLMSVKCVLGMIIDYLK